MATRQHTLFMLIVTLGTISALSCGGTAHPADSVLEMNFRKHKSDFQLLVSMSNEDRSIVRIPLSFPYLSNDNSWPRTGAGPGLSNDRWDAYRSLFQKLGLKRGLTRQGDLDIIVLCASAAGNVTSGTDKGYAYSETELTPTVESLDAVPETLRNQPTVYKSIEPHWYLYYYQGS